VRRAAIEGDPTHLPVGFLDERFFLFVEDIDWCYRLQQAGWNVMVDPRLEILHHKGSGQGWDEWRYAMACRGMITFFRKHHGRRAAAVYGLILFIGLLLRAGLSLAALAVDGPRRDVWRRRLRGYARLAVRVGTGGLARSSVVP
jgi:GT2 family glycosyltransferase